MFKDDDYFVCDIYGRLKCVPKYHYQVHVKLVFGGTTFVDTRIPVPD